MLLAQYLRTCGIVLIFDLSLTLLPIVSFPLRSNLKLQLQVTILSHPFLPFSTMQLRPSGKAVNMNWGARPATPNQKSSDIGQRPPQQHYFESDPSYYDDYDAVPARRSSSPSRPPPYDPRPPSPQSPPSPLHYAASARPPGYDRGPRPMQAQFYPTPPQSKPLPGLPQPAIPVAPDAALLPPALLVSPDSHRIIVGVDYGTTYTGELLCKLI